jgi:hypothetical protein
MYHGFLVKEAARREQKIFKELGGYATRKGQEFARKLEEGYKRSNQRAHEDTINMYYKKLVDAARKVPGLYRLKIDKGRGYMSTLDTISNEYSHRLNANP